MKNKKIMAICLAFATAISLYGCSEKESEKKEEKSTEKNVESSAYDLFKYDVSKYVKLGEYKNLKVEYTIPKVTDEDVEIAVSEFLYEHTEYNEIENKAVADGDYVNIDFKGLHNGEEFEGGTYEGYEFTVGEGEFLDDFEKNIVGKKTGEEFTFKMVFPEDYDETLGGEEVEFTVKINSVSEVVEPDYTDKFVAENTDYDSIKEYEAALKEELLATEEADNVYYAAQEALYGAVENATVEGYPKDLYDAAYVENELSYQSYADMYGMELEDFMNDFIGDTLDNMALTWVNEILVTHAIAEKEGLMITEEEYNKRGSELAVEYGYEELSAFEKDYGKVTVFSYILNEDVTTFLYENAKVTEVEEEE